MGKSGQKIWHRRQCRYLGTGNRASCAKTAAPDAHASHKRIVAIGGGTGLPCVLEGLCGSVASSDPAACGLVTAVVTMTDDGGSSGRLRERFGVLPPGDIRNCLAAAAG